jgi:hypothetical protein
MGSLDPVHGSPTGLSLEVTLSWLIRAEAAKIPELACNLSPFPMLKRACHRSMKEKVRKMSGQVLPGAVVLNCKTMSKKANLRVREAAAADVLIYPT